MGTGPAAEQHMQGAGQCRRGAVGRAPGPGASTVTSNRSWTGAWAVMPSLAEQAAVGCRSSRGRCAGRCRRPGRRGEGRCAPPSRGLASSTVTSNPASHRAIAAVIPARPPPTTTTWRPGHAILRAGRAGRRAFRPARSTATKAFWLVGNDIRLRERVGWGGADVVEQPVVDAGHRAGAGTATPVEQAAAVQGPRRTTPGPA